MSLETCPTCKKQDSVFLPYGPPIRLDGKPFGAHIEGYCNNCLCDQRYWYHPRTMRVTRRNVGLTYAERREEQDLARANLLGTNNVRHKLGLTLLIEKPADVLIRQDVDVSKWERWREMFLPAFLEELKRGAPSRPPSRLRRWVRDWRAWLGALWRVHGPFRKGTSDD